MYDIVARGRPENLPREQGGGRRYSGEAQREIQHQILAAYRHKGLVHEYLGMTIDYSQTGKVKFTMHDYVANLIEEAPSDMSGVNVTPAANNLFTVNGQATKLNTERAELFHHFT